MYVACVPLKVAGKTVQAGEVVPEADQWQETVRRAHINLGWIKQTNGSPSSLADSEPAVAEAKDGTAPQRSKRGRRPKS